MGGTLREQIGKRRGFASAGEEAYLNVVRTGAVLQEPFAALFREHGLSASAYNVLRILRGWWRGRDGARKHCEIGREMVVRVPDVTRLVDRLEKDGLVRRERSATDRRVVHVSITERGLELIDELDAAVMALQARLFGHMDEGELRRLSELLERFRGPHDESVGESVEGDGHDKD